MNTTELRIHPAQITAGTDVQNTSASQRIFHATSTFLYNASQLSLFFACFISLTTLSVL